MSVRERLLKAADELFLVEGIHTVGIDRILERAGVAKASLYTTFGSKEELILAYLEQRAANLQAGIKSRMAIAHSPQERIIAVFDELAERVQTKAYYGCPFVRASSDGSSKPPVTAQRQWFRDLFTGLAQEAGFEQPERWGRQLVMIYDGASIAVWMDADPGAASEARRLVEILLQKKRAG